MRNCRLIQYLLIFALLFGFAVAGFAGDDWKAKQDEMFSKIGLKPGDTIDKSNWEKIKDVLPFSEVEWVKNGDMMIPIGEFKFDAAPEKAWVEKSAANAGKYKIGPDGEMIETATGNVPTYVVGEPFPDIDENDPHAGTKLIWNYEMRKARCGTWNAHFGMEYIGEGGYEKKVVGDFLVYYYNNRPDGEQDNPQGFTELSLFPVRKPYDVAGLVQLNRKFASHKSDDVYAYVPAIRRVKKLSGANRSDPSVGSDFILDDSNGWGGKNTSMNWKLVGKKIMLVPMTKWGLEAPLRTRKLSDGAWEVDPSKEPPLHGYEVTGYTGKPWHLANVQWAPMELYVIEATAKDPYYNYGKCVYYYSNASGFHHKVIYNKAGEYWKTMYLVPIIADFGEGDEFQRNIGSAIMWYGSVDEKVNHATTAPCYGNHHGEEYSTKFMDPNLVPGMYAPTQIAAMTR